MGMGALGRVSRLLLAQLGSVLNYGYLDQATVPGQWPAARLRELIREL
jgi:3-dehydroquinate dehydratase-1